jgi:hypothetical protein
MSRSAALLVAALLLPMSAVRADETFPVAHTEPIAVHVLYGKDGKPLAHAHLLLVAGYSPEELKMQTWREEAISDENGKAQLSNQLANLPFLQVWVFKKKTCQLTPRNEIFSIERIRRDGLSTPNHCGTVSAEAAPGVFTVFVKGKIKVPAKQKQAASMATGKLHPMPLPAKPEAAQMPAILPAIAVVAPAVSAPPQPTPAVLPPATQPAAPAAKKTTVSPAAKAATVAVAAATSSFIAALQKSAAASKTSAPPAPAAATRPRGASGAATPAQQPAAQGVKPAPATTAPPRRYPPPPGHRANPPAGSKPPAGKPTPQPVKKP